MYLSECEDLSWTQEAYSVTDPEVIEFPYFVEVDDTENSSLICISTDSNEDIGYHSFYIKVTLDNGVTGLI